jgi:hypothetical protein
MINMINMTDLADEFAAPAPATRPSIASKLQASLNRGFAGLIKSRQTRADQLVRSYLGQHDTTQLERMGFSAERIKSIRATTSRPGVGY